MSGVLSTAGSQSSDRAASIFVMGTMMGVAVAGAGALALSYYTRMERERFAADARERYARGSRRHSSEGIKDPSSTSAQRERMGRYRRSAGMIASAQVANMARQTSVDTLDSDIDQSHENNAEYIMATEADDLMRASIGSLDGDFMNGGDGSPSSAPSSTSAPARRRSRVRSLVRISRWWSFVVYPRLLTSQATTSWRRAVKAAASSPPMGEGPTSAMTPSAVSPLLEVRLAP